MIVLAVAVAVILWFASRGGAGTGSTATADYQPTTGGGLSSVTNAIATYEGYYAPGSLAARTNNPGDIGTYGGKVASYPDAQSGWGALDGWVSNHAASNPGWDFYDMMRYYLTGDTMGTPGAGQNPDAYAEYVANAAGVDPTTPVSQVIG